MAEMAASFVATIAAPPPSGIAAADARPAMSAAIASAPFAKNPSKAVASLKLAATKASMSTSLPDASVPSTDLALASTAAE
jgi:hypothetical protein